VILDGGFSPEKVEILEDPKLSSKIYGSGWLGWLGSFGWWDDGTMKHADLIDDGGPSLHSLPKEMQQTSAAISSGGLRLLRITKDSYSRDR
jgi:hypothetical protein